MRTSSLLLLVVGVLGCGDDGGGITPIDAPPDAPPDAPLVDAPLVDAPPPPVGHHHYVIDRRLVPTNNSQARDYGLDLNGDQTVDNQLGMVFGTLSSLGIDVQVGTTRAIDTGAMITLVDLGADDLINAATATFALFDGANPMPLPCNGSSDVTCRRHLAGTGTFTAAATPVHPALPGAIVNGTLNAGPGLLAIELVVASSAPVAVTLLGARVRATTIAATGIGTLILAGAVSQTEIDTKVIPAMRDGFMASVTADCSALANPPGCGCATGSAGKSAIDLFDAPPKDCAISVDEVRTNALIQSLLAPDVTINGVMALSLGVSTTAVPAGYVAP